ncbi:hypothetical protein DFP72DRAFT_856981 [Ephemerocybe angulata]|uniref:GDP/GTP exchange factor Sec2 N-terminal domain-containing protein n=1 Tax=Ephemerocybe angulata TaxID=980116 RepID=A0A8H6HET0_9AGAR|nr:hypothetical protein DFP72DRAFT_856981 [Tulosesus angulatus]
MEKHNNLNATQQKSISDPFFLKIEEELHDARRVRSDGQEDDLRMALDMVINRVSELSTMLSEVYKAQAELEVQLNVTRSNLQLVSANNEMLEEALKRNNGAARDLGWRRGTQQSNLERSQSMDYAYAAEVPTSPSPPTSATTPATTDNRFFKFRFSGGNSAAPTRASSRPGTPSNAGSSSAHLTSPSMPSLSLAHTKELEDMAAELEKERAARKAIVEEKAALEAELESLSQALFEEANKMVAEERMKLSEVGEELEEVRREKAALQSALKLLHQQTSGEPGRRGSEEYEFVDAQEGITASRSSSRLGVKSRPASLDLAGSLPLPPSPFPDGRSSSSRSSSTRASPSARLPLPLPSSISASRSAPADIVSPDVEDSQPTPKYHQLSTSSSLPPMIEDSPWADVPSSAGPTIGSFEESGLTSGTAGVSLTARGPSV